MLMDNTGVEDARDHSGQDEHPEATRLELAGQHAGRARVHHRLGRQRTLHYRLRDTRAAGCRWVK